MAPDTEVISPSLGGRGIRGHLDDCAGSGCPGDSQCSVGIHVSGRDQSAEALPIARLNGTPSLSCPHSLEPGASPLFAKPEMRSVRCRVQKIRLRPWPSAAYVRPASVPARTPRGARTSTITGCRVAWPGLSSRRHSRAALRSSLTLPRFPGLLLRGHLRKIQGTRTRLGCPADL